MGKHRRYYNLAGPLKLVAFAAALLLLTLLGGFHSVVFALEQGVFQPARPRIGLWQFLGILLTPGALAVTMTVLLVRYLRVFAMDDGEPLTKRQVFARTLLIGAVFGAAAQGSLQGAVNYLTGMPIHWELMLAAAMFTGLASMLAYEAVRWWMARQIRAGKAHWRPAYDWLSAKPEEKDPETGDDIGHLTQFMRDEDTTQPRED